MGGAMSVKIELKVPDVRKHYIECKIKEEASRGTIDRHGKKLDLPKIRIPINEGYLVLRLANGRTIAKQEQYIEEQKLRAQYFTNYESDAVQHVQHGFLKDLIEKRSEEDISSTDFQKKFRHEQGNAEQTEPILITSRGVIVNGNRRVTFWRMLLDESPEIYKRFDKIDALVLPHEWSEEEINELEYDLQIAKDIKEPYEWMNIGMKWRRRFSNSGKELIDFLKQYEKNKAEIETEMRKSDLAEEYLKTIGAPKMWERVSDKEQIFIDLVKQMQALEKKKSPSKVKNAIKAVTFMVAVDPAPSKRKYATLQDVYKHQEELAPMLVKSLREDNLIKEDTGDPTGDLSDILENREFWNKDNHLVISKIILHESKELEEIKDQKKNKAYLLTKAQEAHTALMHLKKNVKSQDFELTGVEEQLQICKSLINEIEVILQDDKC